MFLARDRNRFSRELQALAGAASNKSNLVVADDKAGRMAATNELIENTLTPLFETYAQMVRKAGRSCDYKLLAGSTDSFPVRAASAEFWLDLTEVPGVAQYFIRFEFDGNEWRALSRPGLGRKLNKHESAEIVIPAGKRMGENIEGVLQQFIRLVF
jgi:hypothetical protein